MENKTSCKKCSRSILLVTAKEHDGMCIPCAQNRPTHYMHYKGPWEMKLANELEEGISPIVTSVLIRDIGFGLILTHDIAQRLRLEVRTTETIVTPDGKQVTADITAPVRVTVENRTGLLRAAVYGDETSILKRAISGFDHIRKGQSAPWKPPGPPPCIYL